MPGYPIRTPWDPRSVDNSPRPIAASHVLHRLLVPRHPPNALKNLATKMLASTVQFSNNNPEPPPDLRHHAKAEPCEKVRRYDRADEPGPEQTTRPRASLEALRGCFLRTQQCVRH